MPIHHLLRNAWLAFRTAAVSAEEAIEKAQDRGFYEPIHNKNAAASTLGTFPGVDSEPPTPTSAPSTLRLQRAVLQTRRENGFLAAAVVALVLLLVLLTGIPPRTNTPLIPITKTSSEKGKAGAPIYAPRGRSPMIEPLTLESVRMSMTKEEYIDAFLRDPVEGLLDPLPIRKKCDATTFQPGLVWHCQLVNGGIGNVGNMWLNCLRYAVEAGASTIILPRINARDKELGVLGSSNPSVDLSTLYDVDYFLAAWKEVCPQMSAVLSDNGIKNLSPPRNSPTIRPNSIATFERIGELITDPTDWRKGLDEWLAEHADGYKEMSLEKPVRVVQRLALSHWNREWHDEDFAVSFPRLFRFPDRIRKLAASALWSMGKAANKSMASNVILLPDLVPITTDSALSEDSASIVTTLGPNRLVSQGYLGVHLRVAEDAAKANWPGYEAQAPAYLDEAQRRNLNIVYLATGSDEHRKMFRADATARGIQVVTKEDLLSDEELAELKKLSWDQQAIVDFEVLLHSSYFAGFVRSSFSWVIAIRRGILPEAGTPHITRREVVATPRLGEHARRQAPRKSDTSNTPIVEKYRDGLSVIVGQFDAMTIMGIWP